MVIFTFSQPNTAQMGDLLKLVIEKADQETLQRLTVYTFSRPHTAAMTDLLRLVIEKADQETLQDLAKHTFSRPHTAGMTDLLRLVIEKADQETWRTLATYTFGTPHSRTDEFKSLHEALTVADPERRRQFLLEKLGPIPGSAAAAAKAEAVFQSVQAASPHAVSETVASFAEAASATASITPSLNVGQRVVTLSGLKLEVVRAVDQGKRGVVFQVKELSTGKVYALKVAKDSDPETLASIADESKKKSKLAERGLPHAAMIEQSERFVVTEWVDGVRGDQWVDTWLKSGAPADAPESLALRALMEASAEKKVYIGDLNPKNLIYQAQPGRWVIVDSGSIRQDLTQSEILERYREAIVRRWSKARSGAESPLRALLAAPPQCSSLLSKTLTKLLAK
jgi:hypothetical protein